MRRGAGLLAVGVMLTSAVAGFTRTPVAGTVTLIVPHGDSLRTATPTLGVATTGFAPGEEPVSVRVLISRRADFATLTLDTTLNGGNVAVVVREPLRERTPYYFRAIARDANGLETFSPIIGPLSTISWLALLSPDSPNGSVLSTPRPRFVWRSIEVVNPPGPWIYDIHIINVATKTSTVVQGLVDTVYTPPFELDANTSYRWAVTARLQNGDTTRVNSVGSFVITSANRPPLTLLYQNFPNPFPDGDRRSTCIWFDLSDRSQVSLEIRDLRGNLVRRILRSSGLPQILPAGQYGRSGGGAAGCDPRFSWDGRSEDGRFVPRGLYLLRLRTDRGQSVKKVYFSGP